MERAGPVAGAPTPRRRHTAVEPAQTDRLAFLDDPDRLDRTRGDRQAAPHADTTPARSAAAAIVRPAPCRRSRRPVRRRRLHQHRHPLHRRPGPHPASGRAGCPGVHPPRHHPPGQRQTQREAHDLDVQHLHRPQGRHAQRDRPRTHRQSVQLPPDLQGVEVHHPARRPPPERPRRDRRGLDTHHPRRHPPARQEERHQQGREALGQRCNEEPQTREARAHTDAADNHPGQPAGVTSHRDAHPSSIDSTLAGAVHDAGARPATGNDIVACRMGTDRPGRRRRVARRNAVGGGEPTAGRPVSQPPTRPDHRRTGGRPGAGGEDGRSRRGADRAAGAASRRGAPSLGRALPRTPGRPAQPGGCGRRPGRAHLAVPPPGRFAGPVHRGRSAGMAGQRSSRSGHGRAVQP